MTPLQASGVSKTFFSVIPHLMRNPKGRAKRPTACYYALIPALWIPVCEAVSQSLSVIASPSIFSGQAKRGNLLVFNAL